MERHQRPKINRSAFARLQRLKALRQVQADELGIEIGVLCPNGTLQAIARAAPETKQQLGKLEDLKAWQADALGAERVLEAVNGASP